MEPIVSGRDPYKSKANQLPEEIKADIDTYVKAGHGAISIIKLIREKYIGVKLPSVPAMNKYVQWRRDELKKTIEQNVASIAEATNNVVQTSTDDSVDELTILDFADENGEELLRALKEKLRRRIVILELEQKKSFDKLREQTLQRYYSDLKSLVEVEIKLKPDFEKESNLVAAEDVQLELTRLFSVIRKTVDTVMPDKRIEFMQVFTENLKLHGSKFLEDVNNE